MGTAHLYTYVRGRALVRVIVKNPDDVSSQLGYLVWLAQLMTATCHIFALTLSLLLAIRR